MTHDLLIRDIALLLTMDGPPLRDGAVAFRGDQVSWVGPSDHAPDATQVEHAPGCVAMPGLVDCHTHTVWAGSRAHEFEERLAGRDYTEILEAGGGILSTVRETRAASLETLTEIGTARLQRMARRGVTTVEIKSGYGLTPADERKMLVAARQAGERAGVRVLTTFLGAHTVPAELRHDRAAYVQQIISEQLPTVADVADFADVYVDRGAFTVDEGRRILTAAIEHGLKPRIHAEQVTHTGAAAMAAALGALSADHLERIDAEGIAAMAAHDTVAVLLPGAMLYLRDPAPPVAELRAAGVPMAVATDFNPGTSPIDDLWTCATLACVSMRLTVDEALRGITRNAARALGREDLGILRPGAAGDLVVVRTPPGTPIASAVLIQHLGQTEQTMRVYAGRLT